MEQGKSSKIWVALVAILMAVNVALLAVIWFGPAHLPPPPSPDNRLAGPGQGLSFKERLKITKEQEGRFQEMSKDNRDKIDAIKLEGKKVRDAYFALLMKPEASQQRDSLASVLGVLHKKVEEQTFSHFAELRAFLKDDQKKIFDSIILDVLKSLPEQPKVNEHQIEKGQRQQRPREGEGMERPPFDRQGPPDGMPPPHRGGPPPPGGLHHDGPPPPGGPPQGPPPHRPEI